MEDKDYITIKEWLDILKLEDCGDAIKNKMVIKTRIQSILLTMRLKGGK